MSRLSTLIGSLCIGLTLHSQIALADTPKPLQDAATKARGDMFKPKLGDLYSAPGNGSVVFKGNGLDAATGTVKVPNLYGKVAPFAPGANDLPDVDKFEDLFPYRDTQLNALESGTGPYSASRRNVEAAAMSVLRGSRSLEPVSAERFLFPSRELIANRKKLEQDFEDCQIITGTKTVTKTSTSTRYERCERQAYSDQPMTAERQYIGPGTAWTHTIRDGKHYCSDGARTTWVEDAATCNALAAFDRVPVAYQILNCGPGCIDIRLTEEIRRQTMPWLFTYASFRAFCEDWSMPFSGMSFFRGEGDSVCNLHNRIRAYEASTEAGWNPDFEIGETYASDDVARARLGYLRYIAAFPKGQSASSPEMFPYDVSTSALSRGAGGFVPDLTKWATTPYVAEALTSTRQFQATFKLVRRGGDEVERAVGADTADHEIIDFVQPNLLVLRRETDGKFYVLNRQEFLRALTSYEIPQAVWGADAFLPDRRYCGWLCGGWDGAISFPLGTGLPAYPNGSLNAALSTEFSVRLGVKVDAATAAITRAVPGTRLTYQGGQIAAGVTSPVAMPGIVGHTGQLHRFGLTYTARPGATPETSLARIVVRLSPTLFTPWVYLKSRWAEIQQLATTGCTLKYEVDETASSGGCVRTWAGQLCGTALPSPTPFTGLTDRGATKIKVTPQCNRPDNPGGFQTRDNCQELRDDNSCTLVKSECIDDVDEAGMCHTYEDTYSCSSSLSYTTPVVTTQNICSSSIACTGEDCVINSSTDGSIDLADTAAKLASVDMILADMNCGGPAGSMPPGGDLNKCEIFKGEDNWCARIVLGLSNCCKEPKGVSLFDYLALAMAVSKLNSLVGGLGAGNAITGAWSSLTNLGSATFSRLTAPLTQMWESIVGNTGAAASSFSLGAVKQALMKSVSNWTSSVFGPQASQAIFTTAADGTVAFTGTVSTVLQAVSIAFTIYTVVKLVAAIVLACEDHEIELGIKRALRSVHEVGTYCSRRVLGICLSRRTSYCTFASPLSRIMNEQIRLQTGQGWGTPKNPDCSGFTVADLAKIDMDRIDLSEWTGMLVGSGLIDPSRVMDLEKTTGTESTLGQALDDLYPRQDAIERGVARTKGANFDAIRNQTTQDFGVGVTQ